MTVSSTSREELEAFRARHAQACVPFGDLSTYAGPCYVGLDAGSTTIKAVVIGETGEILYSHYQNNEGSPLEAAKSIIKDIYNRLPEGAFIAKSGITGYGEFL